MSPIPTKESQHPGILDPGNTLGVSSPFPKRPMTAVLDSPKLRSNALSIPGPANLPQSRTFTRETRSGRSFSTWDEPYAISVAPNFNLKDLLKASVALEDKQLHASLCTLDPAPSPLSSAPSTPARSPQFGTLPLPADKPSYISQDASYATTMVNESSSRKAQDAASSPLPLPPFTHAQSLLPRIPPLPGTGLIPTSQNAPLIALTVKESGSRKDRKKKQSHANRGQRRRDRRATEFAVDTREDLLNKYVDGATPLFSAMRTEESNVARTAYVGLDDRIRSQRIYQLHELVGTQSRFKFKLVEWDGRTSIPIVDASGKVIGVLAGYPGPTREWVGLQDQASCALEDVRKRSESPSATESHRRGKFKTLRCGVSHGGGQTKPKNLSNDDMDEQLAQKLNSMECFKRFSSFATSVVATWAPKLYSYYVEHLGALHAHHPELRRIFTSSIFAASTYNLGPRTLCFRHTDFANLPFGWCSVTALGSFDPKKGGHLVLWECGLVIEFPPGSTILLPSAIVSHSNINIAKSESRYSFTQYTAGGLFRWVENGFQTLVKYRASLSPSELQDLDSRNENRWSFGLSLLRQLKISTNSSVEAV